MSCTLDVRYAGCWLHCAACLFRTCRERCCWPLRHPCLKSDTRKSFSQRSCCRQNDSKTDGYGAAVATCCHLKTPVVTVDVATNNPDKSRLCKMLVVHFPTNRTLTDLETYEEAVNDLHCSVGGGLTSWLFLCEAFVEGSLSHWRFLGNQMSSLQNVWLPLFWCRLRMAVDVASAKRQISCLVTSLSQDCLNAFICPRDMFQAPLQPLLSSMTSQLEDLHTYQLPP